MIEPGDEIPDLDVWFVDDTGRNRRNARAFLGKGRTVLFGVPGAFTPTCHNHHLPGFVAARERILSLGVQKIVCASVNDPFVMSAWAEQGKALGKIDFLADYDAAFATALGLRRDMNAAGLGIRFLRSAIIFEQAVVARVLVDDKPGQLTHTGASNIIDVLERQQAPGAAPV